MSVEAMSVEMVGEKVGMTRMFCQETGRSVPVTVISFPDNNIMRVKDNETDGYCAVQVAYGDVKAKNVNRSRAGQFKQAGVDPARHIREFRINEDEVPAYREMSQVSLEAFTEGDFVDVTSPCSRGKGFAGTIKRHNFAGQRNSHGNSKAHRAPGSIGMCQTPGRVFKNKKMAGQMGAKKVTVQSQKIHRIDLEKKLMLVEGCAPGAPGTEIVVFPAVKMKNKKRGG